MGDGRIKASPLARKIASENGLDLRRVKGSGPGGRIQRSDVEAALRAPRPTPAPVQPQAACSACGCRRAAAPAPAAPQAARPQPAPVPPAPVWVGAAAAPQDEVTKLSRLRGAIGRRMVESKTQVPHFYVTRTFKFEKLMELRKQLNEYLPDDQKLTVNDFIIKGCRAELAPVPQPERHPCAAMKLSATGISTWAARFRWKAG